MEDTIRVQRGTELKRECTLKDKKGAVVDMRNWTLLTFMVKANLDDTDANKLLKITVDLADTDNDLEHGIFYLKGTGTQLNIQPGSHFYDFYATRTDGTSPIKFPSPPSRIIIVETVHEG